MTHLSKDDLLEIAKKIRYDTTAIQAKLTDLMDGIAALPGDENPKAICPHCGPIPGGQRALEEHMHVSHEPYPRRLGILTSEE